MATSLSFPAADLRLLVPERRASSDSSQAERIIGDIRQGLIEGRYRSGQRLVEADLTRQYGVARGPVREALSRLAADGIVALERHRGARIHAASGAQAIESLELLELALGLAGRRAAQRIGRPGAARRLSDALEAMLRFTPDAEAPEHAAARIHLFDVITDIAEAEATGRIVPGLRFCLLGPAYAAIAQPIILARHSDIKAIVAAILAGDEKRAEQAMRRHVARTTRAVRRLSRGDSA